MRWLLVIRGAIGLLFAIRLGMSRSVPWDDFFGILADYLIIDGVAGAVIGIALLRDSFAGQKGREMAIGVTFLVDAAGRVASGIAVHVWPGIPGFFVTHVLFIGVMAAGSATIGFIESVIAAREEIAQHGRRHQRPQFIAGPVAIAALTSTAFGTAAFRYLGDPDQMRLVLCGFVAAGAAVMFAMAWSRHARRPVTT